MTDASRHLQSCTTRFGYDPYDNRCPRCAKIKVVVYLRRKTTLNGASADEERAALAVADSIRVKFGLTRGEIFDRQFETVPTKAEAQAGAFKQTSASRGKSRMRPTVGDAGFADVIG